MFQCPSLGCATRGSCNPVGSICHERYDPADLTTCGVDDGNVGGGVGRFVALVVVVVGVGC